MQQVCGTKQLWETLAVTGRFDADILREALRSSEHERDADEETHDEDQQKLRWRISRDSIGSDHLFPHKCSSETKRPAGGGSGRRDRDQKGRWGGGRSQGRGDEGPQRASSEFCIRRCTLCLILLYHSPFGDAMLRILLPHARGHRVWDSRVGALPVHGRNKVRRWSARRRGLPLGASPLGAGSSRSSSPAPRENVTGGVCRHSVLATQRW